MIASHRLSTEKYAENFSDIRPPFENETAALVEANRCLYCYDAPCTKLCPTHIDVPKFIKQIANENVKGSARTILESNIMGAGCSRVCPVEKLCEGACVYNLLEERPIEIARLQRYSTDTAMANHWKLFERKTGTGKKVAVVGAGPAGLSAAFYLSKEGVEVTIFEKEQKGGGLMAYGIAAYKVTSGFCEEEVNFITSLGGIEISYGSELGKNISLDELRKKFDATFLGFGVGTTRKLGIPGEKLEGVIDAISFIYELRTTGLDSIKVGDKVAVIGMGMTAIDAATQAKRLGAKEVTMLYRRTKDEMPCTQHELDIALLDGCKIIWLAAPKELIGENGKLKQIVCNKMALGNADAGGRRTPVETGETFSLDVDMVIKATGQMPYEVLVSGMHIAHQAGRIGIDEKFQTNIPGVFAGGDAVNGGKEVVDAVQAGKEAAKSILNFFA